MNEIYRQLLNDLAGERAETARVLAGLLPEAWDRPSPADGWLLRDCVVHLAETDEHAAAIAERQALETGGGGRRVPGEVLTPGMKDWRGRAGTEVLAWWQQAGDRMLAALATYSGDERLPWAGREMSVVSFTTARLMEHWSHGLDIHEAAEAPAADTDRLKSIAHLGFITRDFAFRTHGLEPPAVALRVELNSPSGAHWAWGPEDAPDRITGTAGEFCRVVTQRIHWSDTALTASGPTAQRFLEVAQAFAGPAGSGRPPKNQAR